MGFVFNCLLADETSFRTSGNFESQSPTETELQSLISQPCECTPPHKVHAHICSYCDQRKRVCNLCSFHPIFQLFLWSFECRQKVQELFWRNGIVFFWHWKKARKSVDFVLFWTKFDFDECWAGLIWIYSADFWDRCLLSLEGKSAEKSCNLKNRIFIFGIYLYLFWLRDSFAIWDVLVFIMWILCSPMPSAITRDPRKIVQLDSERNSIIFIYTASGVLANRFEVCFGDPYFLRMPDPQVFHLGAKKIDVFLFYFFF